MQCAEPIEPEPANRTVNSVFFTLSQVLNRVHCTRHRSAADLTRHQFCDFNLDPKLDFRKDRVEPGFTRPAFELARD